MTAGAVVGGIWVGPAVLLPWPCCCDLGSCGCGFWSFLGSGSLPVGARAGRWHPVRASLGVGLVGMTRGSPVLAVGSEGAPRGQDGTARLLCACPLPPGGQRRLHSWGSLMQGARTAAPSATPVLVSWCLWQLQNLKSGPGGRAPEQPLRGQGPLPPPAPAPELALSSQPSLLPTSPIVVHRSALSLLLLCPQRARGWPACPVPSPAEGLSGGALRSFGYASDVAGQLSPSSGGTWGF